MEMNNNMDNILKNKNFLLKRTDGTAQQSPNPYLQVFQGHTSSVNGALILPEGQFLSWSQDGTLRIWTPSGSSVATLKCHDSAVLGALVLEDGMLLSWSSNQICWWDVASRTLVAMCEVQKVDSVLQWQGKLVSVSAAHGLQVFDHSCKGQMLDNDILDALITSNGDLLSWSQHQLTLWSGRERCVLGHHESSICGIRTFGSRAVSWSSDNIVKVWDLTERRLLHSYHHPSNCGKPSVDEYGDERKQRIYGANLLPNGNAVSWSGYRVLPEMDLEFGVLLIWGEDGPRTPLEVDRAIEDAFVTPDGRFLFFWAHDSWFEGKRLGLFNVNDAKIGNASHLWLEGHDSPVNGAYALASGMLLSWSSRQLLLWNPNNSKVWRLKAYMISGVLECPDGKMLSWSTDGTLRLWDLGAISLGANGNVECIPSHCARDSGMGEAVRRVFKGYTIVDQSGEPQKVGTGHEGVIHDTLALRPGRLLTMHNGGVAVLWDAERGTRIATLDIGPRMLSFSMLDDHLRATTAGSGYFLTWPKEGGILRLWDSATGSLIGEFGNDVQEGFYLPDGTILARESYEFRLWRAGETSGGTAICKTGVNSGALILSDGRFVTWRYTSIRIWDLANPEPILLSDDDDIEEVFEINDGLICSWSSSQLCVRNKSGSLLKTLEGPFSWVRKLTDEQILIQSKDKSEVTTAWTMKALFGETAPITLGGGYVMLNALARTGGGILSWDECKLFLWDSEGRLTELNGHTDWIDGAFELDNGTILSWCRGGEIRLWDSSGSCIGITTGKVTYLAPELGLFAWTAGLSVGISRFGELEPAAVWHGDSSQLSICHIHPNGTLAMVDDRRHLYFLQLYEADKRIGTLSLRSG